MTFDRDRIYDHAETYWWRPCKDGRVWTFNHKIDVVAEATRLKLKHYGGIFLWYGPDDQEGLFLLPTSQIIGAKDGRYAAFPDAVMLCSYNDAKEDLSDLDLFPPYFGLNDCTHFTSECLTQGGFAVTDEHARRGANELYGYLYAHKHGKVLASDVPQSDAEAVISAGLLKKGDVIVYKDRGKHTRHHGVVYLGDGTIAMHTYHQWKHAWQSAGGTDQLYSLLHLSNDDDFSSGFSKRWIGWWEVRQGGDVRYVFINQNGHAHYSKRAPLSLREKPTGPDYWFADTTTIKICVRGKGDVQQFVYSPPTEGRPHVVRGKHINDLFALSATSLER